MSHISLQRSYTTLRSKWIAALLLAGSIFGCAGTGQMVQTPYGPMPDYCTGNSSAAGVNADANCRRLVAHRVMEMAVARRQATLSQQSSTGQYAPIPVDDEPVAYVSQNGHHHNVKVVQLSRSMDATTKQLCTTGKGVDADLDGKTSTDIATARMCLGLDGKWSPAT